MVRDASKRVKGPANVQLIIGEDDLYRFLYAYGKRMASIGNGEVEVEVVQANC